MSRVPIPSGTITLLFTDIEGSTKLWEAHPEIMRVSLARHDALMRQAIGASNGYVFKTIGDAFCAAFTTAGEAAAAVLAAQLALAAEPWPEETPIKVRMALHTGAVESRDDDYFGPPVNRVARLLSTAHGGQSVLSQPTYELVRDALPPLASMKDLGSHQLKDLARPEQIFQLLHPLLRAEFPPVRSLTTLTNNLPQQLTTFIGREKETLELNALLSKSRLVTLTGSGGTGKTRLSLQVAAEMLDRYADGVWFVELAPISDPGLVARTVADTLGVKEQAGDPVLLTLVSFLRSKKLLIVLDNCEHLVESCAKLVHEVLQKCPDVQVLASSREPLGISGEQTYRVPSLSLPDPTKVQTPQTLSHFEAVRLFIDRAVLSKPDFQVTNQNAPALASLCFHLDGIPLAIELAAARARSMSVEDIDSRLDQRFRLLTGGSRAALPRQQTLKALVDWSYDLLSGAEKALLCRLSVFAGGWTLEAAEAVCAGDPIEDWEVLDLLTSLCDKSLVTPDSAGGQVRYGLLETVREYASDRLHETGGREEYQDRHLKYARSWVHSLGPRLKSAEQSVVLKLLDRERDNLRTALEWSRQERVEDGLWLIHDLWYYWYIRAHVREGRMWVDSLLEAATDAHSIEARTRALVASGNMYMALQDTEMFRARFQQALEMVGDWAPASLLAVVHFGLGNAFLRLGNSERGLEHQRIASELFLQEGDRVGYVKSVISLGVNLELQDPRQALQTYQKALGEVEQIREPFIVGILYGNIGSVAQRLGDWPLAREYHQGALRIRSTLDDVAGIAGSLEGIAGVAVAIGPDREIATSAVRILSAATRMREETGFANTPESIESNEIAASILKSALGEDRFNECWDEGTKMPTSSAIEEGMSF